MEVKSTLVLKLQWRLRTLQCVLIYAEKNLQCLLWEQMTLETVDAMSMVINMDVAVCVRRVRSLMGHAILLVMRDSDSTNIRKVRLNHYNHFLE